MNETFKLTLGKDTYDVYIVKGTYPNGQMAVKLKEEFGMPFATLSVNLDISCAEGCFWAKTWSENAPIRDQLLASGRFKDTGERYPTGYVLAELWELVEKGD